MAWRTIGRWSSGATELISPATTTTPDLASTSQATRLRGSCSRYASRMESAMKSHTLSGCPSVTDSDVRTAWRSERACPSPRFSSSGNAAALLMTSGRAGNRGLAAPQARLAGRLQPQRERAACRERVLGQHLVAPAPGLDHVGRAQRETDALLLPGGQVHRDGDSPQPAVAPEVVVGIDLGRACGRRRSCWSFGSFGSGHGVFSFFEEDTRSARRLPADALDFSLPRLRLRVHISPPALASGDGTLGVLPGCRARFRGSLRMSRKNMLLSRN